MNPTEHLLRGPYVHANWHFYNNLQKPKTAFEFPIFTDAWITGSPISLGPYSFINSVAHAGLDKNALKPAIFVYVEDHCEHGVPIMNVTDTGSYHGGDLKDELAALLSLALGIRAHAGPLTRTFRTDGDDPKGLPVAYFGFGTPVLVRNHSRPILPSAMGPHTLDDLEIVHLLPHLRAADAVPLIRVARLYQQAVWLCESDAAIAWLLLVSAVECAADQWNKTNLPALERLRSSKPRIVEVLEHRCPEVLEQLAVELANSLGATQKFVKFLLHFLPDEPANRPPLAFQVPWSKTNLREIFSKVYDYRSKALHGGIPFPAPMCTPPGLYSGDFEALEERPAGLASSVRGGIWISADTPLHFHTFEYVARRALLKWWRSLNLP